MYCICYVLICMYVCIILYCNSMYVYNIMCMLIKNSLLCSLPWDGIGWTDPLALTNVCLVYPKLIDQEWLFPPCPLTLGVQSGAAVQLQYNSLSSIPIEAQNWKLG